LVILASHALLAIKSLRPLGVLDGLPGKLVERLAEKWTSGRIRAKTYGLSTWDKASYEKLMG
jgi:hypothetical protein